MSGSDDLMKSILGSVMNQGEAAGPSSNPLDAVFSAFGGGGLSSLFGSASAPAAAQNNAPQNSGSGLNSAAFVGAMIPVVLKLINNAQHGSALTGSASGSDNLVHAFQLHGLGDVLSSWIGTGTNLPISGEQLAKVVGEDQIAQIAQQSGADRAAVSEHLAQMLPIIVDKLTPEGKLPDLNGLMGLLGSLR